MKLDDERMVHHGQDVSLPLRRVHVRRGRLNVRLLQDFQRVDVLCKLVHGLHNLAVRTLAEHTDQVEVLR